MARYVRITVLSVSPCEAGLKNENQTMTEYVIAHLEKNIDRALTEKPDILVLPEVCDRPLGLTAAQCADYYNERKDAVLDYLKLKAKQNNCYIAYPHVKVLPDGTRRNCCEMLNRNGKAIGFYIKNYPTIGEINNMNVKSGDGIYVFECDFGKVAAAICFDLNFDEFRMRMKKINPDLIIFCSNFHGGILQNYFAYDTRSYFASSIGYARIPGTIISPVGEKIAETTTYYNYVTKDINLDYAVCHLGYNMDKISMACEKYGKALRLDDPGHLGAVLLSCESEEKTITDIVKEFNIELIDDYFERSIDARNNNIG